MWRKASVLAVFFAALVMLSSCTESPEDPLIPGPDVPGDTVSLSEEEIAGIVDANLAILVPENAVYSSEKEYITAQPEAFSAIVALGDAALPYLTEMGQNLLPYDYSAENYRRILAMYAAYTIRPEQYVLSYPSPDGKYALVWEPVTFITATDPFGGITYNVGVLDPETGETAAAKAELYKDESASVHWSPDSRYAAVSVGYRHSYRDVYVFDIGRGECVRLPGEGELEAMLGKDLTYYDADTDEEFSCVHILFDEWGTDTVTARIMLSSVVGGGVEIGSYTYDLAKREITQLVIDTMLIVSYAEPAAVSIKASYPIIDVPDAAVSERINEQIREFIDFHYKRYAAGDVSAAADSLDSSMQYEIVRCREDVISIHFFGTFAGGGAPQYVLDTAFTFNLKTGEKISLTELYSADEIASFIRTYFAELDESRYPTLFRLYTKDEIQQDFENHFDPASRYAEDAAYHSYYLTENSLVLIAGHYKDYAVDLNSTLAGERAFLAEIYTDGTQS